MTLDDELYKLWHLTGNSLKAVREVVNANESRLPWLPYDHADPEALYLDREYLQWIANFEQPNRVWTIYDSLGGGFRFDDPAESEVALDTKQANEQAFRRQLVKIGRIAERYFRRAESILAGLCPVHLRVSDRLMVTTLPTLDPWPDGMFLDRSNKPLNEEIWKVAWRDRIRVSSPMELVEIAQRAGRSGCKSLIQLIRREARRIVDPELRWMVEVETTVAARAKEREQARRALLSMDFARKADFAICRALGGSPKKSELLWNSHVRRELDRIDSWSDPHDTVHLSGYGLSWLDEVTEPVETESPELPWDNAVGVSPLDTDVPLPDWEPFYDPDDDSYPWL